jgi:hypothetical protein
MSVRGNSSNHGFHSVPQSFPGLVDSHHGSQIHSNFPDHGFGFDDHHFDVLHHHDFDHDPFFFHDGHQFFGHHLHGSFFFFFTSAVTSTVVVPQSALLPAPPVQPPYALTLLVLTDHSIYSVTDYWVEMAGCIL